MFRSSLYFDFGLVIDSWIIQEEIFNFMDYVAQNDKKIM
jgi:hypothetical protein